MSLQKVTHLVNHGGPVELLNGILRFIYWQSGLRSMRYALTYKFSGSPVTRTIGGTSAVFAVSSSKEYARASTLHGERPVIADLMDTLESDDVFYDVGANIGTYTCFAAQLIDIGDVVAFEPHPANIDRLQENAELNDLNVRVQPIALSNETGISELVVSGSTDNAGVGTHSLSTNESEKTLDIKTIEGDRLIDNGEVPFPSIIKIDVEGAEQRVIEGLSSTLESEQCHTIYCEVHPDRLPEFGGSADQVEHLLEQAGYSLEVIESRSPEYFLKGVRQS